MLNFMKFVVQLVFVQYPIAPKCTRQRNS